MNGTVFVEKIILLSFAILGVVVMFAADALPYRLFRNLGSSPGIFPWLLGLLISLMSVVQLVVDFVKWRRNQPTMVGGSRFESPMPFYIVGLSVAFTLLLPWLGYIVATIIWLAALLLLLRPERPLLFIIIMLAFIALTYTFFQLYLPFRLPAGRLIRLIF